MRGEEWRWTVDAIFSAAHQVLRSPVAVFPIELHRLSCQSVCNSVHPSFIHLVIHLYLTRLTCFFTKAAGPTWRGRNNGHRTANSWDESMTSGAEHAHYSITSYLPSHICTTLRLGPSQVRGPKKNRTQQEQETLVLNIDIFVKPCQHYEQIPLTVLQTSFYFQHLTPERFCSLAVWPFISLWLFHIVMMADVDELQSVWVMKIH